MESSIEVTLDNLDLSVIKPASEVIEEAKEKILRINKIFSFK